ncbi:Amino acid adenylation domain-containing protein [Hyella patelloides LEGE 07179]|uniref:Amino acid adenylation domain-containing protein n=1 Tax=Hyella patelloides LEGE 07179 TaxID=945734 RepID=A0A563W1H4_9CYAN|nr:non-ribosomal peptide synthetase [Hyella patelloides]VEP17552.1 Amino acid adenylation domain-containing protein [Hyella patelloides LEGE 07179]
MSSSETNLIRKSRLSLAKQQLLAQRLRGESTSATAKYPSVISRLSDRQQPFPLTDIQQAYWVGRQGGLELGNISTHGYFEIETQDITVAQFERGWQQLIQRHEMLRTIFRPDGQQQILADVLDYQISFQDLQAENSETIEACLHQIRQQMSHHVFTLDRWPLFEIQALCLEGNKVRFCFSLDVLIADAWSCELLFAELGDLIKQPDLALPPLELSFRDYVLAERDFQDSPLYRRAQDYWHERLDEIPPAPKLPLQKSLQEIASPHFVRREKKLSAATWQQLKQRAHQVNLTPSGILLAAFAEILTIWSKNPRFTLNLTLYNRLPLHPEVNQIVGDFTSVTLLAVDNSARDSFTARAKRIQEQFWNDLDRSHYSGVKVIRELAKRQQCPAAALMPVIFTSTLTNQSLTRENAEPSQDSYNRDMLKGLGNMVYMITQTPQVYLDHQVFFKPSGELVLNWDCIEELFPEGLLDEMFAAYGTLLEKLATEDEVWQAKTIQLLPQQQLEQLANFNQTEAPFKKEDTLLHSLFFERVQQQPEATAVIAGDRTLSYQEVSDRALQLGRQLKDLGATPNQLVAVVMEKGWEQVVAVLGVLASGAAYVPIDPSLPLERREYLLKQGYVKIVLTQAKHNRSLEWSAGLKRICVDTLEYSPLAQLPEFVQQPGDIAYVIYTSGSTGMPKGVTIDHQGAVNTIVDINQRFAINQSDRLLALSSLSFDLSVYDIFGTLAAGGTIVIPPAERIKDPSHWLELLLQHQITIWNTVPALMEMLVEYVAASSIPVSSLLRLTLLSGDWLPLDLPDQITELFPQTKVISLGGATEASIWSILYPITKVDPDWKSIPYGRPMANQRFYVLNQAFKPCPLFVPGQLYIGGIGLAKGYWKDEAKTNASFIIHPDTGERLYRTGDLGRYLPDGNIEFLGREDFQVKINGHRIELGEIETAIAAHPEIKATVVTAIETSPKNKQLVAYLVAHQESVKESKLTDELRQFLLDKLPAYMMPSAFIFLPSFPLTPNGKIDRRQLPKPESNPAKIPQAYVAPTTELETKLSQIVQNILSLERVGIYDNFFDLGGNSVHLVKTHIQIRELIKRDIPIVEMFRYPTISALAQYLNRSSPESNAGYEKLTRAKQRQRLQQRRQKQSPKRR